MTDDRTRFEATARDCSFNEDSVHIHDVAALTTPESSSETTAFQTFGALLFTTHDGVGLLVADRLPTDTDMSDALLGELATDIRRMHGRLGDDFGCGDWLALLQRVGEDYLDVSNDQRGAFAMSLQSAVDDVLANGAKYGLDPRATWRLV